jgi:hypothetical protein
MSSFTDPLHVAVLGTERAGIGLARLEQPFSYYLEDGSATIDVPVGFVTDFASIPRPFRPFFCTMGKTAKPALLHDWLLHNDDKRATKVFNEALKVANISTVGRWMLVAFVYIWTFSDLHG